MKDELLYLGQFEVYRRHLSTNTGLVRETLHIMDGKRRLALVETRNDIDDGTIKQLIRYQLTNHLGSAVLELDEEADIISYEEYFPYGSTSYQAVRSSVEVSTKRYRYTEIERDEESGLNCHRARYYAPWLGRWTSTDPKGFIDGLNLYCYALNGPTRLSDATGTQSVIGDEEPTYWKPESEGGYDYHYWSTPGGGSIKAGYETLNLSTGGSPEMIAYYAPGSKFASMLLDPETNE